MVNKTPTRLIWPTLEHRTSRMVEITTILNNTKKMPQRNYPKTYYGGTYHNNIKNYDSRLMNFGGPCDHHKKALNSHKIYMYH